MTRFYWIKYTLKHKRAFLRVEKQLLGYNTLRGYLHDLDKVILYPILGKELTSKLHKKWSRHHNRARTIQDMMEVVCDWECARFTKEDKPLSAREFLYKHNQDVINRFEPILQLLGL